MPRRIYLGFFLLALLSLAACRDGEMPFQTPKIGDPPVTEPVQQPTEAVAPGADCAYFLSAFAAVRHWRWGEYNALRHNCQGLFAALRQKILDSFAAARYICFRRLDAMRQAAKGRGGLL